MSATAPTRTIPPRPFEPSAVAPSAVTGPAAQPASGADRAPWYRRVWVLIVGAAILALLCFGSGFIAGSAASLFDGLLGGPDRTMFDGGPGFPDGGPPGDGRFPGSPDDTTSSPG